MIKNDVEKINNVFLIKKLMHDLPYARAKKFFSNLRENYDKINKYDNLSKDLESANNELKVKINKN